MSDEDEELSTEDDEMSEESFEVLEILEMVLEDDLLSYSCRTDAGVQVVERAELCDGGTRWRMLRQFERAHPPPWDDACVYCDGEGCGECVCEECGRACQHIAGLNYGCPLHPVV